MGRSEYLDAVAAELKRLTSAERAAVRRELDAHIEDHMETLRGIGCTDEEADARATATMGDPIEVGRGIAKLYRPVWLWLERIATALIAVTAIYMLLGLGMLVGAWDSVYARACRPDDEAAIRMDERMAVGDDVVRLYGVKGYRPGEACQVELWFAAFDRVPFGCVHQNIWSWVEIGGGTGESERLYGIGGSGRSGEGATFYRTKITLAPEDTAITLRYERFGQAYKRVIDLTEVGG